MIMKKKFKGIRNAAAAVTVATAAAAVIVTGGGDKQIVNTGDEATALETSTTIDQQSPTSTVVVNGAPGSRLSPEEESSRNVIRLEAYAKNLVILSTEENPDFDIDSHVRLIQEFKVWFDDFRPQANDEQKALLDAALEVAKQDPYFQQAVDAMNSVGESSKDVPPLTR
jgi:hypothetical protein